MVQVEQRVKVDHILSLKIPNMDLSPAPFQSLLPISKLCSSEHCPWAPDARPGGIRLRLRVWNGHLSSLSYPNPAHRRGGSSQRHCLMWLQRRCHKL